MKSSKDHNPGRIRFAICCLSIGSAVLLDRYLFEDGVPLISGVHLYCLIAVCIDWMIYKVVKFDETKYVNSVLLAKYEKVTPKQLKTYFHHMRKTRTSSVLFASSVFLLSFALGYKNPDIYIYAYIPSILLGYIIAFASSHIKVPVLIRLDPDHKPQAKPFPFRNAGFAYILNEGSLVGPYGIWED